MTEDICCVRYGALVAELHVTLSESMRGEYLNSGIVSKSLAEGRHVGSWESNRRITSAILGSKEGDINLFQRIWDECSS